jgi:hypothetical protein
VRAADADISYSYSTVLTALPLNFGSCANLNGWNENCRVIINYPAHIQPLWERNRIDSNMVDRQCISCHTNAVAGVGLSQVPPGTYQLDLTQDGTTDAPTNPFYYKSYEELVSGDNRMIDNNGTIEDEEDVNMNPIPIGAVMTPGNANSGTSSRFFDAAVFTKAYYDANVGVCDANTCPHWDPGANGGAGGAWLSTGEMKLLSEWADIGAQYYNNPFAVP